jgi:glycosyltransferase involved in cell wall biosynthesis
MPCVVSDISVFREVGGGRRFIVRCFEDVENRKNTVLRLLDEVSGAIGTVQDSRQRATAHAARFSWSENVRQMAQIYQKLLYEA